jgi:endonuclease/exonuclease/phosphatase family metal-dependent hydrolase
MSRSLCRFALFAVGLLAGFLDHADAAAPQVPVVSTTNVTVRVMAANITGNSQTYESFALRIFQGLKPDVVAIQEFNYLGNTFNDFRSMLDTAFGTNFVYIRETGTGYTIPNGVISRWPILESGSWEDVDTGVNDRGFCWARIGLPGTNDLFLVSIHLKASSGSSNAARRAAEAAQLKGLIQSNFPANAWIVVAGDGNINSSDEAALATFKSFLEDDPIPTDVPVGGDADTNNSRAERYDYVFSSPNLNSNRVATVIGSRSFPNGLVFDSRIYSPLGEVAPVVATDSGLAQHMAVMKDFRVSYLVTNLTIVPQPTLQLVTTNVLHWIGLRDLTYTVQQTSTLTDWVFAASANSETGDFWFTNSQPAPDRIFFRVTYP